MSDKRRYSKKGKRRELTEAEELEREERLLDQLKLRGRIPTPPSGHFHDTGGGQRQARHEESIRLKTILKKNKEN